MPTYQRAISMATVIDRLGYPKRNCMLKQRKREEAGQEGVQWPRIRRAECSLVVSIAGAVLDAQRMILWSICVALVAPIWAQAMQLVATAEHAWLMNAQHPWPLLHSYRSRPARAHDVL